jgi:retron-type reverse transcriptase
MHTRVCGAAAPAMLCLLAALFGRTGLGSFEWSHRYPVRVSKSAAPDPSVLFPAGSGSVDDILYLGRGVSGHLHERTSDFELLRQRQLPLLAAPTEIAEALAIPLSRLRWLAYHSEHASRPHYVYRLIPKRSGGERQLSAPRTWLKAVQRWIREEILNQIDAENAAQGFVKGRSVVTNAVLHSGQRLVLRMDLADFFPSIGFGRVRTVFQRVGYSPAAASIFALLCTECPRIPDESSGQLIWRATGPRGLPQGAGTSPALSNLACRHLDRRLQGLAVRLHLRYTRYADDLTFSGGWQMERRVGWLLARIREIVESEGFRVREEKTRVQRRHVSQRVTGLVVNDHPGVPRAEIRRLRAILHRAGTEGLSAQNREGHRNFGAWVQGRIGWIRQSRPGAAELLRRAYEKLQTGGPGVEQAPDADGHSSNHPVSGILPENFR